MPAAPSTNSNQSLSSESVQFIVLIGDEGNRPTQFDEIDYLEPVRIHRSSGGDRLDTITLDWNLSKSGHDLVDTTSPVDVNRVIEIRRVIGVDSELVALGRVAESTQQIDRDRGSVFISCRLDPYLFGEQTDRIKVKDTDGTIQEIDDPIEFNPLIDGQIVGNAGDWDDSGNESFRIWLPTDSALTDVAAETQGRTAQRWTLAEITHTLCWMLNPLEVFFVNPSLGDLAELFRSDVPDELLVRDLRLKIGLNLPEVLDLVLTPYGFSWFVRYNGDDTIWLEFYKRNQGESVDLFMGRPGDQITRDETNTRDLTLNTSIADLANRVVGKSSKLQVESTFELFPGWPADLDSSFDFADVNTPENVSGSKAYRWFVLNEGGDYDSDFRACFGDPFSFGAMLADPDDNNNESIVRRRKFRPALSHKNTEPRADEETGIGENGFSLQFREKVDDLQGGFNDNWMTVNWPFKVLEDQCGIKLTSKVEAKLYKAIEDFPLEAPLRITATVESDYSSRSIATRRPNSPNGEELTLTLDLSSRFHMRRVDSSSIFHAARHRDLTNVTKSLYAATPSGGAPLIDQRATFSIDLNLSEQLHKGSRITIQGSSANDGTYTVAEVVGGNSPLLTVITVEEPVDNDTVDGAIGWRTSEAVDTERMQMYCEGIRDVDDAADVSTSVELDGVDHPEYSIGKTIGKVAGRNLSLNANDPASGEPRNLQIVGINYELQNGQVTELVLESYRVEKVGFDR